MLLHTLLVVAACFVGLVVMHPTTDDHYEHEDLPEVPGRVIGQISEDEKSKEYWYKKGLETLEDRLMPLNKGIAKNVILFLGDGMSIPTSTATRVYLAHQTENGTGEELQLSFEKFPHAGLSKTYCVDRQVADSACSATAYLGGVKANVGTIGVTAAVPKRGCNEMNDVNNHVHSLTHFAQLAGKRTGVVTTTRLTDASPAGNYGHTCYRSWESDSDVLKDGFDPEKCRDLAHQLVHGETGSKVNVYLGGGYRKFIGQFQTDPHGQEGERDDGRNLVEEWQDHKEQQGATSQVISNRKELLSVAKKTEYVLGIFSSSNMPYNFKRNQTVTPSLAEMTESAIKLLSTGKQGYFLFVEGGLIDKAHHASKPRIALDETAEFHKAVERAVKLTNAKDTLIIVTADHAHTMSLGGYASRGGDVLGLANISPVDNLPYTVISYANGPGYRKEVNGTRHDMSKENLTSFNLKYPSPVPLTSETHGGDDVGIYARGPFSHLFTGVNEQSYIPHAVKYASCLGDGITVCDSF